METSIRLPSYFRRFLTYQAVATDCTQTRIFPHPLDALLLIFGSWQRANSKTVAAFCHRGPLLRIDWRDCRKAILNFLRYGKAQVLPKPRTNDLHGLWNAVSLACWDSDGR